jgi:hypothetical protein
MAEPQKHEAKQPQFLSVGEIEVVNLIHPAGFDSEAQTVIIGRNAQAAIEMPHGVLIQRYVARNGGQQERYLLPWANIRSVKYASPTPKA